MAPRSTLAAAPGGLLLILPLTAAVLFLAWYLGRSPSFVYVAAPLAAVAGLAILRRPRLGLLALIVAALALPLTVSTGTEVQLNPATLLVPALLGVWLLGALPRGAVHLPPSAVNRPLLLFLAASLVSFAIGNATWDPLVARKSTFWIVQLAQWAIFAFAAGAFWLTALLARDERWLRWMTVVFLALGGLLALLRVAPELRPLFYQITTGAVDRAPFWLLLSALAGGQLLFNRRLPGYLQAGLGLLLAVSFYYAFFLEREGASTWIGVATATTALIWLRFRRLRLPVLLLVVGLAMTELLFPALWDFAGGDEEWTTSGQSRLVLIDRVIEVTMHNPITGLGPAAYRPYANMKPLLYGRAFWIAPQINSHNNYVDLFAHGGVLGLMLFFWFAGEYVLLGLRLRRRYLSDFAGGYVAAMLATGAGALAIMFLADWMLPFVYNIGFHGFQAALPVWLFLGGLVTLENQATGTGEDRELV